MSRRRKGVFTLLLGASLPASSPPPPPPPPSSALFFGGWNNDFMQWYSGAPPEIDLIGGEIPKTDVNATIPSANRSPHGDVITVPGGSTNYSFNPQLPNDNTVTYELTWDEGTTAGGVSSLAQAIFATTSLVDIANRKIQFTFTNVLGGANGAIFRMVPGGGGKYATNPRCRPVGANPATVLNPDFADKTASINFGGFMRSTHWTTVENYGPPNFPNAPTFDYPNLKFVQDGDGQFPIPINTAANRNKNNADPTYQDGVPLERQLRIAKAAGVHFWYNAQWDTDGISAVGVLTTSTHHTDCAQVAAAWSLDTGKLFAVEAANEVWNPGYTVFHQCVNEAAALGITSQQWYAKKSLWIWSHYVTAFNALGIGPANGASNKLVRVLTAQNAGDQAAFPNMLATTDGASGTVLDHTDMLAVAPYADGGFATNYTGAVAPVIAATKTDIDSALNFALTRHYPVAQAHGLKFAFYECGENNLFTDPTFQSAFYLDPGQYDNKLYMAQRIELLMPNTYVQWFNLSSPVDPSTGTSWGLVPLMNAAKTKAAAPRLKALIDFKNGLRILSAAGGTLLQVSNNSPIGTSVGFVTPTVAASTWGLTNNLAGLFAINATTGEVTVAASLAGATLGSNTIQVSEINPEDVTGHFETNKSFVIAPPLLSDNFNGGVLDASKWTADVTMLSASGISATSVTASVASSEFQINFGTGAASHGNAIKSVSTIDLTQLPKHFVKFTTNGDNGHPRSLCFGTPGGLVCQLQRHDNALWLKTFNNDGGTTMNGGLATVGSVPISTFPWARLRYEVSDDTLRADLAPSTASNPPLETDWVQQFSTPRGALPLTGKIGLGGWEDFGTALGVILGFDGFNIAT